MSPGEPDWNWDSHALAFTVAHVDGERALYVALNAYWEPLTFQPPPAPSGTAWHRVVDTATAAQPDGREHVVQGSVEVAARASVVLLAH